MMTFQWGKNPDHTIWVYVNPREWSLPVHIGWTKDEDAVENKYLSFTIGFLCFYFEYERWVYYDQS